MLWSEVLANWKNGIPLQYPADIKDRFQWNTSVLKNNGNVEYKESFKTTKHLAEKQNKDAFIEHIKNSKNKYVVYFNNLSKDAMLVVPMPIDDKNYVTLKDFIDNAPEKQQQKFWKAVAKIAKKMMKEYGKVWVSVSGFGVDYTHVRVSILPKYYFDDELKKD